MHCPQCGQLQISDQTRFCSRCGFLLTGVARVMANDGEVIDKKVPFFGEADSKRWSGVKQGIFIFLLSFIIVPLLAVLTVAVRAEPFLVALAAISLSIGGALRVIYALLFQSAEGLTKRSTLPTEAEMAAILQGGRAGATLPPANLRPANDYVSPGSWRDTNELADHPMSVTDSTTKLLEKEMDGID